MKRVVDVSTSIVTCRSSCFIVEVDPFGFHTITLQLLLLLPSRFCQPASHLVFHILPVAQTPQFSLHDSQVRERDLVARLWPGYQAEKATALIGLVRTSGTCGPC